VIKFKEAQGVETFVQRVCKHTTLHYFIT